MRDRNSWFDKATTISYSEQGDITAQNETMTPNSTLPVGVAFSMDENGTVIPDSRTTEPEPAEPPDLARENDVLYAYEYDSYGNWTQQTENHGPDKPSYVRHRKLTYY